MQIIFLHPKLKQARTVHVTRWGAMLAAALLSSVLIVSTAVITHAFVSVPKSKSLLGLKASSDQLPIGASAANGGSGDQASDATATAGDAAGRSVRQAVYLRQNIDVLADTLGHMQARLTRLDSLGARVSAMVGLPAGADAPATLAQAAPEQDSEVLAPVERTPIPSKRRVVDVGGRGGPLLPDHGAMTLDELRSAISEVSESLDHRAEQLNLIESEFLFQKASSKLVPTRKPLSGGYMASRFGRRIDPITGRRARHDGLDFGAARGTPILAAGAGVVVYAARHSAYGNQVDIDHGNGLLTRYAHARRLHVKAGDIVRQGQKIAEVGSTGRSTGPHLHFEVRLDDVPQNPMNYLGKPQAFARVGAATHASR